MLVSSSTRTISTSATRTPGCRSARASFSHATSMSSGRIGMRSPAKSGNLPGVTATEGMTHDYDDHSQYQRAVADTAGALIAQSVGAVALNRGDAFVVADYGSSTGGNSIKAVRTAIECARAETRIARSWRSTTTSRRTTGTSSSTTSPPRPTATWSWPARPCSPSRRRCRSSCPPRPRARSTSACPSPPRTGSASSRPPRCPRASTSAKRRARRAPRSAQQADDDWTAFLAARHRTSPPAADSWCRWSGPPRARSTAKRPT